MDDALKTRSIKYLNVETWWFFAPSIKMSGYAPVRAVASGGGSGARPPPPL